MNIESLQVGDRITCTHPGRPGREYIYAVSSTDGTNIALRMWGLNDLGVEHPMCDLQRTGIIKVTRGNEVVWRKD